MAEVTFDAVCSQQGQVTHAGDRQRLFFHMVYSDFNLDAHRKRIAIQKKKDIFIQFFIGVGIARQDRKKSVCPGSCNKSQGIGLDCQETDRQMGKQPVSTFRSEHRIYNFEMLNIHRNNIESRLRILSQYAGSFVIECLFRVQPGEQIPFQYFNSVLGLPGFLQQALQPYVVFC